MASVVADGSTYAVTSLNGGAASSSSVDFATHIVRLTAMTLQERCTENRHMENSTQSKFHSSRVPQITMWDYLKRIAKYSSCSPECFIIAIIYLDRYVAATQIALTFKNIHRLTITAVMVAAKLRDDIYYANSYYASIGGVQNAELNMLELEFLSIVGWDTWVEPSQYDLYVSELMRIFGNAAIEIHHAEGGM